MPFLITTLTLGGARVIEAVSVTENNKVTEVTQPPYKSRAEG
jgi:hypothetical protein